MLHCSSFTLKRSFPFFFCECRPFRWLSVQLTKSKLAFIQLQSKYAPWFSRILELPCSCPHEVNIGTVLVILQHKLSTRPSLMKSTTMHEINSHQINFPDDQLLTRSTFPRRSTTTRSTFPMTSTAHEINFPWDQLPPDQLFPWDQLSMRLTSHEINFPRVQLPTRSTSHEINFLQDQLPMRSTFHESHILCISQISQPLECWTKQNFGHALQNCKCMSSCVQTVIQELT